jgi:rRNA large subunit m3Psi methyltransferase rlmH
LKITILCAGKIKEKYFEAGITEYTKRLSRYTVIEIKQVQDEKTPDNASEAEEEKIKQAEGARMLDCLKKAKGSDCYVFALVIKGKEIDSVELSEKISELTVSGKSHLVFIIGGSLGLSDEVIAESDYKLSFSKLTFPHQLMRLILLEQIYRAFRIKMGEPYHK